MEYAYYHDYLPAICVMWAFKPNIHTCDMMISSLTSTVIVQLYKRIQSKSCDYIGLHKSSVDEV